MHQTNIFLQSIFCGLCSLSHCVKRQRGNADRSAQCLLTSLARSHIQEDKLINWVHRYCLTFAIFVYLFAKALHARPELNWAYRIVLCCIENVIQSLPEGPSHEVTVVGDPVVLPWACSQHLVEELRLQPWDQEPEDDSRQRLSYGYIAQDWPFISHWSGCHTIPLY